MSEQPFTGWRVLDADGNVVDSGEMPEMTAVAAAGDEDETEAPDGGD